ncbi:MAG: hypothetical protein DSO04_07130 [Hadesarchaea archaeon]|nr:MAG: hypothetical protein DSO04_07130 [Hadesarchaea archaeon]
MRYDPLETEASKRILLELLDELGSDRRFGLVGGWAVHSLINRSFLEATGREYLRSRDIDVFLDCTGDFPGRFARVLGRMGFVPGEYRFRYTLILDRESMGKLDEKKAREKQPSELIYVYLEVLGYRECEAVGVWPNKIVGRAIRSGSLRLLQVEGREVFAPTEDFLFLLKADSLLGREGGEKRMKDACDLYGLLFYSPASVLELLRREGWKSGLARRALNAMLEEDVLEFIAGTLFGDRYKSGLVRRNLLRALEGLEP